LSDGEIFTSLNNSSNSGIAENGSIKKFYKTLDMLIDKKFPFKTRTTVHSELLKEDDINSIILDLSERKYIGTYYLQNYLHVKKLWKNFLSFHLP
jgi:pyruvate-formate lyase-activating enzyme